MIDRDNARELIAEAREAYASGDFLTEAEVLRLVDALESALPAVPVEGEVEWEYCIAFPVTDERGKTWWSTDGLDPMPTLDEARDEIETGDYLDSDQVVRRRKAGEWEVAP